MRLGFRVLFVFFAVLCLTPESRAQSENPNPGPRSSEESSFLYEEGSKALEEKNFKQAIRDFRRIIDRYPTHGKIEESYLGLLQALTNDHSYSEIPALAQELLLKKPSSGIANRARALLAEAKLNLKDFLGARTVAAELLNQDPAPRQIALARAIRFQSFLEDKQHAEAKAEMDLLEEYLEKNPQAANPELIPGLKMSLATRQCTTTHLLKDKVLEESEFIDYFSSKGLCFKSALSSAQSVNNSSIIQEWCDSFTLLNHELEKRRMDPFLKEKLAKELKTTFEFAKGINPDLVKCYAPYKPPKSKKRHRKSRH